MDGFALICGGGGGLGKEAGLALAEAGVEGIIFADLSKDAAEKAAEESKTVATHTGYKTAVFGFDVTKEDEVNATIDFAVKTFGRIDYAINAVGVDHDHYAPFAEIAGKDFDHIHGINTKGLVLSLGAQIRAMKKQENRILKTRRNPAGRTIGRGVIVNMVSAAGIACRPGDMLYTVSKHAGMALTKMAALDHAKDGIRINAICPSWVRGPVIDKLCETNPEIMGAVNALVPWNRMAEPEEVSAGIVFLCSPGSSYMNGTYMLLDNGATLNTVSRESTTEQRLPNPEVKLLGSLDIGNQQICHLGFSDGDQWSSKKVETQLRQRNFSTLIARNAYTMPQNTIELPDHYGKVSYNTLRLAHVPESAPEATPVIVLTLYRPKNYNAFTTEMMAELEEFFNTIAVDNRVKAVVVTGHGKMFCAGADLGVGFVGGKERPVDHKDGGGRVALAIHHCRKPVIAAIQGSSVGVGMTMTLPMTIRIAYKGAKIGFPFARRAIVMEACSSFFLPRLIGHSRALHLVATGATYPADHPLLSNLFSETLDKSEDVLPRALTIADEIVKNSSTVSFALMNDLMYRGPASAEETHMLDSRILYEMFGTADNKEAVKSFLEKRQPNFKDTMENNSPAVYPWWPDLVPHYRPKATVQKGKAKL